VSATTRVRNPRESGYSVGISIWVSKGGEMGLYENGLRQNVLFLYQLFAVAPGCRRVHLLNHGEDEFREWPPNIGMDGVPVVRTPEVIDDLDYVIVIGASLDAPTLADLKARGVKVVGYKGGNGATISMEAIIAKPPRTDAERYFDLGYYDSIWMTPQHIHTYAGWARTLYRVPVEEVPQVWQPTFIDNRRGQNGGEFGYQPGKPQWRVGVMEPNITVMKTCHMPMLVCEAAYRAQPDQFSAFYITNTATKRDIPHLVSFANALSAVRDGKMTFELRYVSADFLSNHADAIVTHHWENGLNYLWYEVLHGAYPLIHNSPWLREYGYYYPDFAADEGGKALLHARATHDANFDAYKAQSAKLIDRVAPTHPANIALHEGLLLKLG
jgi:hypothetical protein